MKKKILLLFIVLLMSGCKSEAINIMSNIDYFEYKEVENGYSVTLKQDIKAVQINVPSVYKKKKIVEIQEKAFLNNTYVKKIRIPEGVVSIQKNAFKGCSNLDSISIPNSISFIGKDAFSGTYVDNTSFEYGSYIGNEKNPYLVLSSISGGKIHENTKIILEDAFLYWRSSDLTIPKSVIFIGENALESNTKIQNVSLETGSLLKAIPDGLFFNCSRLESVDLPATIESIGKKSFENCTALKKFTLPKYTQTIEEYAFAGCSNLVDISSSTTIKRIEKCAFTHCKQLRSFQIYKDVQYIGEFTFEFCDYLKLYCEMDSQPDTWSPYWNYSNVPVTWSFK